MCVHGKLCMSLVYVQNVVTHYFTGSSLIGSDIEIKEETFKRNWTERNHIRMEYLLLFS